MSIESTEQKMRELYRNYEISAEQLVNSEVRSQLQAIKEKNNYEKLSIETGMGTWYYSAVINGKAYKDYNQFFKESNFKELNEFLQFMAGQYSIYADDAEA